MIVNFTVVDSANRNIFHPCLTHAADNDTLLDFLTKKFVSPDDVIDIKLGTTLDSMSALDLSSLNEIRVYDLQMFSPCFIVVMLRLNMSLQYTMDNPAFFPEDDDDRLIEEELKSLERTTGSSKTSLRTKQKQKQDIDIVDLFLAEEEEKQGLKETKRSERSTKKPTRKRAEESRKEDFRHDDSRNENVDSGMGSMPSRNGDEDEDVDDRDSGSNNDKTEHSINKRLSGDENSPVPDVIKPRDKNIDDTVLNMDDYDAEDEDDINKNISDNKLKVRTVHVLPAHNEEAAILSTILVGMSIEAQYPPQLYSKIFKSYRMAKILGKMTKEEKSLILKMVEDF